MAQFQIEYNTKERGLPTLFQYQYFTIGAKSRKSWDYEHLDEYLLEYTLGIAATVLTEYAANPVVSSLLKELDEVESKFVVSRNDAARYTGKKQYIKCRIPVFVLQRMKKLFVSTLVHDAAGLELPEQAAESMEFLFDTDKKTVTVTKLKLYEPENDPYFQFARNAAASLSVEAIGLDQYTIGNSDGKVKDFYDHVQMSGWKAKRELEKETAIEDKPGIYMLYDANANTFYVGKAIRLKSRIKQHADDPNGNDPIPNFTHYRYSVISGEYYEFLYLIENAAIHDAAWLLEMPAAKRFKPALVKLPAGADLNTCKMVNNVEHQTRKQ